MLIRVGRIGRLSLENHCASSISLLSVRMSPLAYCAAKPIISECGNGQGWLSIYLILQTSTFTSSRTSLATVSSRVSPGSTNPARVEYIPAGKRGERARRISSPRTTDIMTAGESRGKLINLQAGQIFAISVLRSFISVPHLPQNL